MESLSCKALQSVSVSEAGSEPSLSDFSARVLVTLVPRISRGSGRPSAAVTAGYVSWGRSCW